MKRIVIKIAVFISLIFIVTGCKNNTQDLEKNLSNIELMGNLVTETVYYHNVASYKKLAQNGLLHLFDEDRETWAEYKGIVELGIDLTKVKINVKGNKINVFIPKTDIMSNSTEGDITFYQDKAGWLNGNKVTLADTTEAKARAEQTMQETAQKDTQLLKKSQYRAKYLIEERIKQFSKVSDKQYSINWEYEEN